MLPQFVRRCWGFAVPLMILIIAGPIMLFCGVNDNIIFIVTNGGSFLVITCAFLYAVVYDSRKRWPDISTFNRFARIITFYRG